MELKGYVGPSTPETVRLYMNLSLSSYVEIPRNAVVNILQEGDSKTGPVKLYVRNSATIVTAVRHSASTISSSRRAGMFAGARRPGGRIAIPACQELCILCALGHELDCAACITCGILE